MTYMGRTEQRIRVLQVIARLNIGGPALIVTLLAERLNRARYDPRLVTGVETAQEGNYLELHGRTVPGLSVLPELGREIQGWSDLNAIAHLIRLMREFRPHIVHTHTAKAGTLGRLAARLARVPVVIHTYHGHVLHSYFSPAKTKIFLAIEHWLARYTDRLIAVSEQVRSELLNLGIGRSEHFLTIPLGLELDHFLRSESLRGQLRTELNLSAEVPLVGIVARLVPIKRHEWFLEAAAKVKQRYPQCRFLVVGDGERRAELQALTGQLGLNGAVRFLGWRHDLDRIYADLDILALTSANEGSPVSLIEAMAAGKPVIATKVGGVPDLVENGEAGLLAPPGDTGMLAEAMNALLANPQRRQIMGQVGRQRVYPAFSAQRLVQDIDRLYTELVGEKLHKKE